MHVKGAFYHFNPLTVLCHANELNGRQRVGKGMK